MKIAMDSTIDLYGRILFNNAHPPPSKWEGEKQIEYWKVYNHLQAKLLCIITKDSSSRLIQAFNRDCKLIQIRPGKEEEKITLTSALSLIHE
jgi:hypothetical protein